MAKIEGVALRGVVAAVPGQQRDVRKFGGAFDEAEMEKLIDTVGLEWCFRVNNATAGDLCLSAARQLLTDLDWQPESVDGVVMVTQTPDHFLPATACIIHGKLGLKADCFAFDVGMGCSGYVYGLWLAAQAVASGAARRVLLLAGDTISKLLDPQDRSVAMLFGDAGSATAIEVDRTSPPMTFVLGRDGAGADNLIVKTGGFRDQDRKSPTLYMDGMSIFNFTLARVPGLITSTLASANWAESDVDFVVMHQANRFMLKHLAKKCKIPLEKIPINIDRFGNTSMASIPLVLANDLADALKGTVARNLILAGFGVGYSWAAAAIQTRSVITARVIGAVA